jgi:hypothetical protein
MKHWLICVSIINFCIFKNVLSMILQVMAFNIWCYISKCRSDFSFHVLEINFRFIHGTPMFEPVNEDALLR